MPDLGVQRRLATAASAWVLFSLSDHCFSLWPYLHRGATRRGTRSWMSYAFYTLALEADMERRFPNAKTFYVRALVSDPCFRAPRVNFARLLYSTGTPTEEDRRTAIDQLLCAAEPDAHQLLPAHATDDDLGIEVDAQGNVLTVSIGLAIRHYGERRAGVIERADRAMYAAKGQGPNWVSLAVQSYF